jgi:hypothetical protein
MEFVDDRAGVKRFAEVWRLQDSDGNPMFCYGDALSLHDTFKQFG